MRRALKSHTLILSAVTLGVVTLAPGAIAETGTQRRTDTQHGRDSLSGSRPASGALTPAPGRPIVVKGWEPEPQRKNGGRQIATPPNPPRENGQWGHEHGRERQAQGERNDRWGREDRWERRSRYDDRYRPWHRRYGWFGWW